MQTYLKRKYSEKDIKEAVERLSNLVKDCPVSIRLPETILTKILDDGKFKNQHETGTSEGFFRPEYRKSAEEKAFGEGNNPIYGYISTNKSSSQDAFTPEAHAYGAVKVVFKDEVRNRTTITAGDSLNMFTRGDATGSPLLKPDHNSLNGNLRYLVSSGRPSNLEYIEAQIHGPLTVKDIDRVVLSWPMPGVENSLKEKGIPFTVASQVTEDEDI